jgi:GNAT superfamily N-acetyltransferase
VIPSALGALVGAPKLSELPKLPKLPGGQPKLVLLARDGTEVAGHLVGRLKGPGSVHPIRAADLESIHVYAAHRNRGIGDKLMTAFLAWATEKGAQRATVTAYAANDGARRFYARHRFAVRTVTLDLDLPRKRSATRSPDHGRQQPGK